jgi:hypothetical protein
MQIILLNDHLLVASRKKRKVEGTNNADQRQAPSKLVADRCWPLLDIEMVDLAGTSESSGSRNKVADAIMVRGVGQESFTYRTEKPDDSDKQTLMMNFRKAVVPSWNPPTKPRRPSITSPPETLVCSRRPSC